MTEHSTLILTGLIVFVVLFALSFYVRTRKANVDDVKRSENVETVVNSAPTKNSRKI